MKQLFVHGMLRKGEENIRVEHAYDKKEQPCDEEDKICGPLKTFGYLSKWWFTTKDH